MRAYGCVKCQKHHGERDGAIFHDHLAHQSKHGIYHLSERDWALARLTSVASRPPVPDPADNSKAES